MLSHSHPTAPQPPPQTKPNPPKANLNGGKSPNSSAVSRLVAQRLALPRRQHGQSALPAQDPGDDLNLPFPETRVAEGGAEEGCGWVDG